MSQRGVEYTPNAGSTVGFCFLAVLLPPIPVFLVRGVHADLLINFLLFIFGWLPGVIHAIYIVTKYANPKSKSEKTKYDISGRHAPSPGPAANEVRPSVEHSTPAVQPFVSGAGSSSNVQPQVQELHQELGRQERDLPVYEEVASGSLAKQRTFSGDVKGL